MPILYAALDIGGVTIDMTTEATELTIATPPLRRSTIRRASDGTALRLNTPVAGKRSLNISASGLYIPDLSSVDFDDPVLVQWVEKDAGGGSNKSMTILSDGIEPSQDVKEVRANWTLRGEEV